jgi:hypothetical protein
MPLVRRALALVTVLAVVGLFQVWFMGLRPSNLTHRIPREDLIDSYVQALASGQSNLIGQREGWGPRILDASYFRGQVYVYYGIGPFVLLLVPWFKLTGTFLSPAVCIVAALLTGYAAQAWTLWTLFREDRRTAIDWLMPAGLSAAIVAGGTWSLMDMANIHQLESSAAFACTSLAIAFLATVFAREKLQAGALVGAAFSTGFIMACRPNCLPAVVSLVAVAGYLGWKKSTGPRREVKMLALVGLPLFLIGFGLAAWNYVRFESISEFGMSYGTGAEGRPSVVGFSLGNVVYNLHRYLFGGVRWGDYFPFIEGMREGPFPLPLNTHESLDQVYGSILLFPVLVFALAACWKKKSVGTVLLTAVAGNLLLLAGLGFGTYRYPVDYQGILALAAGLGICCIGDISNRTGRKLAMVAGVALLAFSGAACVCLTASISRTTALFDRKRPRDFAMLARGFNGIAYQWEKISRSGPGAIRLNLILPANKFGDSEPLLVCGALGLQDFLYLYYTGPGKIQIGFESMGQGGPVSAPVKIDYAQSHVVDITLGSLLPPDDHPLLRSIDPGDLSLARQCVRIAIDGKIVLEHLVQLHPTRSRIFLGESPDNDAFGRTFTGTLVREERALFRDSGIAAKWERGLFGPIAMKVKMELSDVGTSQPLVSIGNRPTGGMLILDCVSSTQARFKWVRYDGTTISSEAVNWVYGELHALQFDAGCLLPPVMSSAWNPEVPQAFRDDIKESMRVMVDGREVWGVKTKSFDVAPSMVRIGENAFLLPPVVESLQGRLIESERLGW